MPSARLSSFKGGGGILRDQDGVILDIRFTPDNPLAGKGTPKPGQPVQKKSDFKSLFAVLYIRPDGSEQTIEQPVWVGDATQFEISEDGRALLGDAPLSKSSGWFTFLESLVAHEFDETQFPDDDPNVADYSALRGARCRFGWQKNTKATEKYGQKVSSKDPKKKYDREDLVVVNYYGQVDVEDIEVAAKSPVAGKTAARPNAGAAKAPVKKSAAPVVDVKTAASEQIILAVNAAKDKTITKAKLSVKLLTQMQTADPALRSSVRDFALKGENLGDIEGIDYNAETETLTLSE